MRRVAEKIRWAGKAVGSVACFASTGDGCGCSDEAWWQYIWLQLQQCEEGGIVGVGEGTRMVNCLLGQGQGKATNLAVGLQIPIRWWMGLLQPLAKPPNSTIVVVLLWWASVSSKPAPMPTTFSRPAYHPSLPLRSMMEKLAGILTANPRTPNPKPEH